MATQDAEQMRETEQILHDALEVERLHDEEICQRVSMSKILDLFPEVKVAQVAQMRKIIAPDGVWVYSPTDGLLRNSEHEELDKLDFYARLCGYTREVARIELANPEFWHEEGETDALADEPLTEKRLGFTLADLDLLLPAVSWLWEPWLPRGMVTLLVGESGVGKSGLALAIAAAVLDKAPWPDKVPRDGDTDGFVVWIETENAHAILRDRATNWGVPKGNLLIPAVSDDPLQQIWLDTKEGWEAVEREVCRDGVAMMVLDSLSAAYRGDENAASSMHLINKLAELVQRRQIPALVTHHLNKPSLLNNGKLVLHRVRGSSAIVQIPRCVWALDKPDPLVPNLVRLQQIKNNLARFPEPRGFEINDSGISYTDAPTEPEIETQRDKAADLLLVLLKDGPMLAADIYEEGEGAGVSKRTMQRAKTALGVVSSRKEGRWFWALPSKESL